MCALFFPHQSTVHSWARAKSRSGQYAIFLEGIHCHAGKNGATSLFLQKHTCPCFNAACSEASHHPKWHNSNNHAHSSNPIFITTCTCGCLFNLCSSSFTPFFGTNISPCSCSLPQRERVGSKNVCLYRSSSGTQHDRQSWIIKGACTGTREGKTV